MGVALEIYRKKQREKAYAEDYADGFARGEAIYSQRVEEIQRKAVELGIIPAVSHKGVPTNLPIGADLELLARLETLERQVAEIVARKGESTSSR